MKKFLHKWFWEGQRKYLLGSSLIIFLFWCGAYISIFFEKRHA